jgi:hypothetical protein
VSFLKFTISFFSIPFSERLADFSPIQFSLSPTMTVIVDYAFQATEFFDDNHVIAVKLGL